MRSHLRTGVYTVLLLSRRRCSCTYAATMIYLQSALCAAVLREYLPAVLPWTSALHRRRRLQSRADKSVSRVPGEVLSTRVVARRVDRRCATQGDEAEMRFPCLPAARRAGSLSRGHADLEG